MLTGTGSHADDVPWLLEESEGNLHEPPVVNAVDDYNKMNYRYQPFEPEYDYRNGQDAPKLSITNYRYVPFEQNEPSKE